MRVSSSRRLRVLGIGVSVFRVLGFRLQGLGFRVLMGSSGGLQLFRVRAFNELS